MRTFDVFFPLKVRGKNKRAVYKFLSGQKAIKIMNFLIKNGFKPFASTEANGICEVLNLKEMKNVVL